MTVYTARRARIQELLEKEHKKLLGQNYDRIDYEVIARLISVDVGVPVVVFPAPASSGGDWKLVAYEVVVPGSGVI